MTDWHRLGSEAELLQRVPFSIKLERHQIAVFFHDGQFRAISNICNHKGGPLCEGRLRDEFVMCPWHGWEYSVITGKGPEGYDEEQVPVFAIEVREDGVYVATPPAMPRKLIKHKPSHLLDTHEKPAGAPARVLALSTSAMDDANPRFSTSDALLEHAIGLAKERGAETQLVRLNALKFATARGTTPRPPAPAPGRAPSRSATRTTSSRWSTRASSTGRTWCSSRRPSAGATPRPSTTR